MPYLKLNLPLNGDADGGRQNFRVKIHSLEKWRQEVSASPQNRFTNADKDFAIDGRRFGIVDEECAMDWTQGAPSSSPTVSATPSLTSSPSTVSSPSFSTPPTSPSRWCGIVRRGHSIVRGPATPIMPFTPLTPNTSRWSESSAGNEWTPVTSPSSPKWPYASGVPHIESRVNELVAEPEEIAKQRWKALKTLEGDRMPVPKRKLTGWHTPIAGDFKQQEAQEEIERLYIRRMLQSAVASPQHPHLRGWQFLQHVIASSLDAKTTGLFPPYFSLQRAVVVLIDKVRGREQTRGVRCLDRCSDTERAEALAQVEERGWRDVVWVTGFIDDIPSKMDTNRKPITLHWGQGG